MSARTLEERDDACLESFCRGNRLHPRSVERVSRRAPARRCLALVFPWLSIDRLRATRPHLFTRADDVAVALVESVGRTAVMHAVDRVAAQAGLSAGMTLAQARARVPTLAIYPHDAAADHDWLEALTQACGRWSPAVALVPPDALVLEIAGHGEGALAAEVEGRFARRGVVLRHAFGATPAVALALARFAGAPAPDEGGAVRRLPVAALELDADITADLTAAGMRTLGDVMALIPAAAAARFGGGVSVALRRLTTTAPPIDNAASATEEIKVERTPVAPIWRTEQLLAVMADLMEEAVARLDRQEGARAWEARLFDVDGRVRRLSVDTDRPVRDVAVIVQRLRERLVAFAEPIDSDAGYDLIRLSITRTEPLSAQHLALAGGLSRAVEPAERAHAVRRRRAASRGGDDAQLALPTGVAAVNPRREIVAAPPAMPIHLFDPPEAIQTVATDSPDGPPRRFRWRRRLHDVARAEGPEQSAPERWHRVEPAATRDYYRIEDQRGRRLWIFRLRPDESAAPRWYVHGLFA